jgi:recombinational DNA repair ATPase RecF
MLKSSDRKSRKWLKELIQEAITNLATQIASRRDELGASVATNLAQYVSEVLKETADLAGQQSTEAANAS